MNPYKINMNGGDVDMDDENSQRPGSNYYYQAEESNDALPNIPYESYKIERQAIERYCEVLKEWIS